MSYREWDLTDNPLRCFVTGIMFVLSRVLTFFAALLLF